MDGFIFSKSVSYVKLCGPKSHRWEWAPVESRKLKGFTNANTLPGFAIIETNGALIQ